VTAIPESSPSAATSRILAEFLAGITIDRLPSHVRDDTVRSLLDWLGSAVAGSVERPARLAQGVASTWGSGRGATMFAVGPAPAAAAAFANGVAAHILELDDVHRGSTLHAGAPVIAAALAAAERAHSDGRSLIAAVAVGYECALRIGEAVNPSHYRYWHPTGTCATFGAAAAVASIMRLSAAQFLDALGSAGTQAAGLWQFNADGTMSKHLHPGKAAFNGLLAADLAAVGFTGASQILEGDRGFLRATAASYDVARITEGLGATWKISENCYKLHSCCGHTHSAIDVAIELASSRAWSRDDVLANVAGIHIDTYGPGFDIVQQMNPCTPYQAKFSLAYCVAAALLERRVGLEQFSTDRFDSSGVRDTAMATLLARTRVAVDPALTAKYPAAWPGRVTLALRDGTTLQAEHDYPRGNPENAVTTGELEAKFMSLVSPCIGRARAAAAVDAIRSVERCDDVSKLFGDLGRIGVVGDAGASVGSVASHAM
jgi:2-methylcitrate dehydratase PrpD